jgi:DNA-binding Xre family transcriptional regulator
MPRAQPWPWRRPGRPSGRTRPVPAQPLPVGRIYLRVGEVARARGKRNIRQLAQATGLAYTTSHTLMRHPDRVQAITFETLARLCAYLGCSPADLLGYGPPGRSPARWDGDLDDDYLLPAPLLTVAPAGPESHGWDDEAEDEYIQPAALARLGDAARGVRLPVPRSNAGPRPQVPGRPEWDPPAAAAGTGDGDSFTGAQPQEPDARAYYQPGLTHGWD